jgi:colicin import membrane protein
MGDAANKGFWMSALLHGAAAATLFIFTYVVKSEVTEEAKVFELVAGEGDNFMAREAPALGTPGGIKVDLPEPPAPRPAPPEPVAEVVPAPLPPAPKTTPTPTPPVDQPVPNFKKAIVRQVIVGESRAKRDIAKEKAAEKKRLEAEKKRLDEEKKRMTKEEFDRLNKGKGSSSSAKSPVPKVAKVDAEGIAKGVVGGSRNNKTGGAGGKALTSDNEDVLGAYFALFKQRLRTEFEPPPGLSDSLKVLIDVRSHPDGSLSNARVTKSSGSREFDEAVLEAIRRVRMPARPDKKTENVEFVFSMRERNEG